MKNYKFKIEGLDCANCASTLESKISNIEHINNVSISFMSQRLSFDCEENNHDEVVKLIKKVIKKEEPNVTIGGIII